MNDTYPYSPIASAIRGTIGATIAAYLLFMTGTIAGGWAAIGAAWWDWQVIVFLSFLVPYLFLLTAAHPVLALLTIPVAVIAWYVCIRAESTRLRIGMLLLIFAVAFGDAYYTLMVAD